MTRAAAWAGLAAIALLLGGATGLRASWEGAGWLLPISMAFGAVGGVLALKRARNPIGWLFLAFGLSAAACAFLYQYAYRALVTDPGSLPGADLAASLAVHLWHPAFAFFVFAVLLFPEGRLLSPRWRWAATATAAIYGTMAVAGVADRTFLEQEWPELAAAEPLVTGPAAELGAAVFSALLGLQLLLLPLSGASLLLRLRRAHGDERQQLKVFVFTVAFVMFAFPLVLVGVGTAYGVFLFPLVPVAAAVAILRYRLYDIDVVIRRTLVYGALTATLAATYGVLVVGLQAVLARGSSQLAVAASTLAVAALFGPARRRIQAAVDRRFFRRRYDAERTLERFGARVRRQVELDAIEGELCRVVDDTMGPAHVSLWVRR